MICFTSTHLNSGPWIEYLSHEALSIRLSGKGNLSSNLNSATNSTTTEKLAKSPNIKPYDLSFFRAFTSAILFALWLFTFFSCCHLSKLSLNVTFSIKTFSTFVDRCERSFFVALLNIPLLEIFVVGLLIFFSNTFGWLQYAQALLQTPGIQGWSKWRSVYCGPVLSNRTFCDDGAILYLCCLLSVTR